MTKPTKWHVRPAKTQISLGIRQVWSESSLCAQWLAKDPPSFLHADSDDSDQTGRMPRLIWVFAGRTCHFVGFVMMRLKFRNTMKGQYKRCQSAIQSEAWIRQVNQLTRQQFSYLKIWRKRRIASDEKIYSLLILSYLIDVAVHVSG